MYDLLRDDPKEFVSSDLTEFHKCFRYLDRLEEMLWSLFLAKLFQRCCYLANKYFLMDDVI